MHPFAVIPIKQVLNYIQVTTDWVYTSPNCLVMACERTGFDKIENPSRKAEIKAILLETVLARPSPTRKKDSSLYFLGVVC